MSLHNTHESYGLISRILHWLTAFVIIGAIAQGMIGEDMPRDSDTLKMLLAVHKTTGIAAFFLGAVRIIWTLTQAHPQSLHPARRLENAVASFAHWMLYIAMIAVPLSGWLMHAASDTPIHILWPFGQNLPFVPESYPLAKMMKGIHNVFSKLLILSLLLHVIGALKHQIFDRDAVMSRMSRGVKAAANDAVQATIIPALFAVTLYIFIGVMVVLSA